MTQHNTTQEDRTLRIIAMNIENMQMNKQELDILHETEHADELSKLSAVYQNQQNTMMMLINEQINNEIAIIELTDTP